MPVDGKGAGTFRMGNGNRYDGMRSRGASNPWRMQK